MKIIFRILLLILLLLTNNYGQSLKAYYTNLEDSYDALEMDKDKIFGKYADIIVEVEQIGQIIFSKSSSYLPILKVVENHWRFEEIVKRNGDGKEERPDILSQYSHVRLISSDEKQAIVHWRYFPDFQFVEWDGVVDEYFTINSNGKVIREIRKGTKRIDDWNSKTQVVKMSYQVSDAGIDLIGKSNSISSKASDSENIASSKFDDSLIFSVSFNQSELLQSNRVVEEVSKLIYEVSGNKTLIKKGVNGKSLHFDGYYSSIHLADSLPSLVGGITIESWIALGAYPFGVAPILHQSIWEKQGYYLGINENGNPIFNLSINGEWKSVVYNERLDLFKWYQIVGSFNSKTGKLSIFVNGKEVISELLIAGNINIADTDIMIGLNSQLMPNIEGRISRGKWPSMFGIDGLIDEVKIYNRVFESVEITNSFIDLNLSMEELGNPDMQKREMPEISPSEPSLKFGAEYRKLKYYETWDNLWRVSDHPDIVISFDEMPVNIVSWRGISHNLYFVTENGKWVGDQSNEDYRLIEHPGDAEGCLEHMSDKQCRHAHVRIIENTDARVVIHWRYGLVDSKYNFAPRNDGWGGWTDEYWTIYPDGVAIRDVARGIVFGDGWVETMFLSAPGTMPEENVDLEAFSIINDGAEKINLSWADGMPSGIFENVQLTMVNSKSEYKMYNVYPTGSSVEVFGGKARRSKFHWWNHWPVSQITSDGRGARAADRMAHSSLVWGAPAKNMLMYGITDKPLEDMKDLAKSWNSPPPLKALDGNLIAEYQQEERAYLFSKIPKSEFIVEASKSSPLLNPCFVIKNWESKKPVKLWINNNVNNEKSLRQGLVYDTHGKRNLIIWVKCKLIETSNIRIE